ncbi:MAG: GDP-mannose 4,6-dehydratase [Rhodocyclaceae bacterium]|nr:GDP-mannose 4,6-dehydratase [Rhodocyclaceae bacterium]MCA3073750.1 GDP-mannose 4,6-dehydratase [Rhodocyclaceae bacterium]MCA3091733.1 GDP-mannose 4,6-dehydratase [Rhodocyclaceae bacterium]MCA3093373.1 GDP-mannose 4,6-dehydratase [Rhodocyclaceae bacterium]MCA3096190.1 GDP-mannose 4,6-dehydratase [Rhodocyclaceae bacterium]
MDTILVTGGAGFIGANFVLDWLAPSNPDACPVVNLDALTYAGNLASLEPVASDPRHRFVHGDINDRALIARLLREHRVRAIVNFAAESHVDRSILGPDAFVQTNIVGTFNLIEATRDWLSTLDATDRAAFRFIQVSTDEVFGALEPDDPSFSETTPFSPRSPYSASKASADHLVQAAWHTYGLPAIITHCSNNYGPLQFPEKLVPLMIRNARRSHAAGRGRPTRSAAAARLLPAVHADARRHPGGATDLDAAGHAAFPAAIGRRLALGPVAVLRGAALAARRTRGSGARPGHGLTGYRDARLLA